MHPSPPRPKSRTGKATPHASVMHACSLTWTAIKPQRCSVALDTFLQSFFERPQPQAQVRPCHSPAGTHAPAPAASLADDNWQSRTDSALLDAQLLDCDHRPQLHIPRPTRGVRLRQLLQAERATLQWGPMPHSQTLLLGTPSPKPPATEGPTRFSFLPAHKFARVRYTFIQIAKKKLIQKHFHPKTLSSKNGFIQ